MVENIAFNVNEPKKNKVFGIVKKIWVSSYLAFMLISLVIFSSIISPYFLSKQNLVDVIASNVTMSLLALGMFFVILTGGIDLSMGSIVALSGCLLAGLLDGGMQWYFAVIATMVLMIIPGAICGIAIGYAKIPPFIATLAMMTITRGLAYIYQVGSPKPIYDDSVIAIGNNLLLNDWIPLPLVILVGILILSWFVLGWLPFGRRLYAIGDNIEAAYLSGLPVSRSLMSVYIISSLSSGLVGIILASRLTLGSALVGSGYELDAIASVVLGGAALTGGKGNPWSTVLGAYTFGFIANILNLLGIGGYPQMIIKGIIIIAALLAVQRKK
ncbi:MAG: ABC transporter permease [Candidatus Atribacteria bacterium]|nr:ABC transporter permease [Candidatus Atribacteria bacterium]